MIKLDKDLISKKFSNSLFTYDKNAIIQKKMAEKLVELIKKQNKKFKNILEIGSYTGILTKEFNSFFNDYSSYLALDVIDSYSFIKKIDNRISFKQVDIENFKTDKKFDLIISNASLQWVYDFNSVINKLLSMLSENGILAITIFGEKNLYEIKDTFGVGLEYLSSSEIKKILPSEIQLIETKEVLEFENPIDILKHLKYTGVNAISKNKLTYKEIKEKLKLLETKYKNKITYCPLYIVKNH